MTTSTTTKGPLKVESLLSHLAGVQKAGSGWQACCPAHEDRQASLTISTGDDGRILLHCHAGCAIEAVVAKLGVTMRDLMPNNTNGKPKIVTTYDYRDKKGVLLYQVVRFDPKDFRQRRPKSGGGWDWSIKGLRRVPYRLPELLSTPLETIIYIPEGEKDVDNLVKHGLVATCNSGGAGKWLLGFRQYFQGRRVVILPDKDKPGREHGRQIVKRLDGIAASVKVVELPGDGKDVSDWFANGGTVDKLLEIFEAASDAKPETTESEADEDPGKVKILADLIEKDNHFAQDGGGKLYRYEGGVFRPKAESYVKAQVKRLCVTLKMTDKWSSKLASEVVEYIRVDSPTLPDRPRLDLLNVENGMVRIGDGVLLSHSPEYLSVVQLPVRYDPAATCPNIETFVASSFPPDADDLAWEIPGVLMVPATWLQKAILLLGEGCNGKSVYLALLVRFLGRCNVSTKSLHKLEKDKFAVARLVGKLANICADLPSEHLAGTSTFKELTGGDTLDAEYKFKDSFDLEPFARLVFSANHPPRSADSSPAFFRRWTVVPFDHTFTPDEQIPRDVLDARLQAPGELSGLLNKAIEGLRRVQRQKGFSESESVNAAWRDFHAATDPLAVWLDRRTIDDPDSCIPKNVLRIAYNSSLEREGRPAITPKAFGQALYRLRPDIDEKQRTIGGKLQWCFIGIALVQDDSTSQDSRDSRDSPLYSSRTHAREDSQYGG